MFFFFYRNNSIFFFQLLMGNIHSNTNTNTERLECFFCHSVNSQQKKNTANQNLHQFCLNPLI